MQGPIKSGIESEKIGIVPAYNSGNQMQVELMYLSVDHKNYFHLI
jgi:hypothetical protein